MKEKIKHCSIPGCTNELWWSASRIFKNDKLNTRKHYVCGNHLPIDGLPEDWGGRDPRTPISDVYREPEEEKEETEYES